MAQSDSEYHHGEMNVDAQVATFHLFNGLTKWGSLAVATVILTTTLWFCVGAGFLGGAIPGAVLVALGVVFLRDKPAEGH
jgi:hypothetical protein